MRLRLLPQPGFSTCSRHGVGWALALALLAALGGCATPVPPESLAATSANNAASSARPSTTPHTELQGQLSIKLEAFGEQAASGLSLGFFFTGDDSQGQLDLMTLMGSQIAQVGWTPQQAWLVNDKGRTPYASLDQLSLDTLGEVLPLRALVHWMAGRPDPSLPSQTEAEPGRFTQQGWSIDATALTHKRLQAHRPATAAQRGAHIKVYLDL